MIKIVLVFFLVTSSLKAQTALDELAGHVEAIRSQVTSIRSKTQTVGITNSQLDHLEDMDALINRLRADAQLATLIDGLAVDVAEIKALVSKPLPELPPVDPIPTPLPEPIPIPPPPVVAPPITESKLIQKEDLIYEGSFRVPSEFTYGGRVLSFNPVRNTLLLSGHDNTIGDILGEINIHELLIGPLESLNTATIVTIPFDPFEGVRGMIAPIAATTTMGGVWAEGDSLYMDAHIYYDAAHSQRVSHFERPLDFSDSGQVKGPFATTAGKPGYIAGYFASVPPEWQERIGGRVINGLTTDTIISRTSNGASAWLIEPTNIGAINPIPVTPLVFYPYGHPIDTPRGGWHSASGDWQVPGGSGGEPTYWNGSGSMGTAVWPNGTDTLLFFGVAGIGPFCYGYGTYDPALHGKPTGISDTVYCYDLVTNPGDKSQHGFPYVYRVWAYKAEDLLDVKNGVKQSWELLPYTYWDLSLPLPHASLGSHVRSVLGATAYDPSTGRIFVAQQRADAPQPYARCPVIHVFRIR